MLVVIISMFSVTPLSLTDEGGKEANIAKEVKVTQLNMLSRKKVNESVQLYSR